MIQSLWICFPTFILDMRAVIHKLPLNKTLYISIRYRLLCPNLQNLSLLWIFQESWLPSCPLKYLQVLWSVLRSMSFIYMQENVALAFKNVNESLHVLFSFPLSFFLLVFHPIYFKLAAFTYFNNPSSDFTFNLFTGIIFPLKTPTESF